MGSGGSKKKSAPPPKAVAGVPPQPPYLGPQCEYKFENFVLPYVAQSGISYLPSPTLVLNTLDLSAYLSTLSSLYDMGFRLVSFSVMPTSVTVSATGIMSSNITQTHKYQAICRKAYDDEKDEKKSLKIVRSILPSQVFTHNSIFKLGEAKTTVDTHHMFQTIFTEAANGARLICVEITGHNSENVTQAGNSTTTQSIGLTGGMQNSNIFIFGHPPGTLLGVDIFFEIPSSPSSKYVYQGVPVPMHVEWGVAFQMGGKWTINLDWVGVTSQYLGQGWKLVEVFLDQNNSSFRNGGMMATKITANLNCIFFFEKEESKMNDNTPIYEATMVEYLGPGVMKMAGIGSTTCQFNLNWEPFVTQLGKSGWEIIRILDTPAMKFDNVGLGSMGFKKTMYAFAQRKIVKEPPKPQEENQDPPAPVLPPQ